MCNHYVMRDITLPLTANPVSKSNAISIFRFQSPAEGGLGLQNGLLSWLDTWETDVSCLTRTQPKQPCEPVSRVPNLPSIPKQGSRGHTTHNTTTADVAMQCNAMPCCNVFIRTTSCSLASSFHTHTAQLLHPPLRTHHCSR